MPQVSSVSGVTGGIDASGRPQQTSTTALLQLAMAAKAQEEGKKREEAQKVLEMIKMGLPVDPSDAKRKIETGFGVKLADPASLSKLAEMAPGLVPKAGQPAPQQGDFEEGAPPFTPAQPIQGPTANKLGTAFGGSKAGAQAGAPPSPSAARKAPGGGVTPSPTASLPNTAEDVIQQMSSQAFQAKQGEARNLGMEQQLKMSLMQMSQKALQGDPKALARLALMEGRQLDPMAAYLSARNDKEREQVYDAAVEIEKASSLGDKWTEVFKSIDTDLVPDPSDRTAIATALADGRPVPFDVQLKMGQKLRMSDLRGEADAANKLIDQGFPVKLAWQIVHATKRVGLPVHMAIPQGLRSLAERKVRVEERKATVAEQRLEIELDDAKNKDLKDLLMFMATAERSGMPVPDEIKDKAFDEVAQRFGMKRVEVPAWWKLYLGTTSEFMTSPEAEEFARRQAGLPQKAEMFTEGGEGDTSRLLELLLQSPMSGFAGPLTGQPQGGRRAQR